MPVTLKLDKIRIQACLNYHREPGYEISWLDVHLGSADNKKYSLYGETLEIVVWNPRAKK